MKGIIENDGCLSIWRNGVAKLQHCPFNDLNAICGDWCPLFDDSDVDIDELRICQNKRLDVTDNRKKGEK